MGQSLPSVLAGMRSELQQGHTIEAQEVLKDGGGTTHSILIRRGSKTLVLWMRYDSGLDRFHIVGYSEKDSGGP